MVMAKSPKKIPELSPGVIQWVNDAVGAGATINTAYPLEGATSSELHRIEVEYKGRKLKLVLRLLTNEDWLREEPDLVLHEASNLQKAREAGVPTPELIAYDADGTRCGVPAILMTQLPGSVDLKPANLTHWLHQMAEVLLPIHSIACKTYLWHYSPYNEIAKLEPPVWSRHPRLWERALEIVSGFPPVGDQCFIHRDYHPTNVLWQKNRISGLVDWANACLGPACIDVSWCRANLAGLFGVPIADQFLQAYQSHAGPACEYHPFWDLMVIIEVLPGPPDIYPPWITFGVHDLTDAIALEREDEYLSSVIARL